MTLSLYFFRQFLPPFLFGSVLFLFVLVLDKLFDVVDLLFNKGVSFLLVSRLFSLFIPTVLPLTFPMAVLLACIVTFGRISEESELTATRAAGISLYKVLWAPPLFALAISALMVPFNTRVAPWSSREFQRIYQAIVQSEPLVNIEAKKFFTMRNIKIYAHNVDRKTNRMTDIFVYQMGENDRPPERIYAHDGEIASGSASLSLTLRDGQMQRWDAQDPGHLMHTTFSEYRITIPLNVDEKAAATKFRSISTQDLDRLIDDLKAKNLPYSMLEAERSLRYAVAFAPICLLIIGIPLATVLKRGGRTFSLGISIVVIFAYYLLLIFGLTLAEKGTLPSNLALWIGNGTCLIVGTVLFRRMVRQ